MCLLYCLWETPGAPNYGKIWEGSQTVKAIYFWGLTIKMTPILYSFLYCFIKLSHFFLSENVGVTFRGLI